MKTSTTYRAELEIPIPESIMVFVKQTVTEEEAAEGVYSKLIFSATSDESLDSAKATISGLVTSIVQADMEDESGVDS